MKTVEEIKRHLRAGDYTRIGELVGVSRKYAFVLLGRPNAEKHLAVKNAAIKVAKSNIDLGL